MQTLDGMTWERWQQLTEAQRDKLRDTRKLHPELAPLRGWRVEVKYYGVRKRFIIGQTTGWKPATLGLYNRRSMSSSAVLTPDNCKLVRAIEKVR